MPNISTIIRGHNRPRRVSTRVMWAKTITHVQCTSITSATIPELHILVAVKDRLATESRWNWAVQHQLANNSERAKSNNNVRYLSRASCVQQRSISHPIITEGNITEQKNGVCVKMSEWKKSLSVDTLPYVGSKLWSGTKLRSTLSPARWASPFIYTLSGTFNLSVIFS